MKIILTQDLENFGNKGAILNVKDGYARNFLFPKGFAVPYTESNYKNIALQKKSKLDLNKRKEEEALDLKEKLSNITITIKRKSGENGKLFGSVTSKEIEEELKKLGFDISKKEIFLEEHIKTTGIYDIPVKLYKGIEIPIKLWVVGEEEVNESETPTEDKKGREKEEKKQND